MSNRYSFIICTYACQLAFSSDNGETVCIHYRPMYSQYVITKRQSGSESENTSTSQELGDRLPILAWQPGYRDSRSREGVVCVQPCERSE